MHPPQVIETNRLHLRVPRLADAEVIFQTYAQDPEVSRFLVWPPHRRLDETRAFLLHCRQIWGARAAFPWVIERREDRKLLGMVEMRLGNHGAELGYVLARPHWGLGYMTEAVQALVDWALAQEQIYRVWAVCDLENLASQRVMEKVGMRQEGVLHRWVVLPNLEPVPRDCYCYARFK